MAAANHLARIKKKERILKLEEAGSINRSACLSIFYPLGLHRPSRLARHQKTTAVQQHCRTNDNNTHGCCYLFTPFSFRHSVSGRHLWEIEYAHTTFRGANLGENASIFVGRSTASFEMNEILSWPWP
jgi:hypothetical protein